MSHLDAVTDAPAARTASSEGGITISGLRKEYSGRRPGDKSVFAVDGLDLEIHRGEIVALLGPSGCGKTTTLRCVAGLEEADAGTIVINDRVVARKEGSRSSVVPAERRNVGMVFQSYALWPHLTVLENVVYPLRVRRVPRAEAEARVRSALDTVDCQGLAERYPGQLSGGQQQRVALARALVSSSEVVLFDEPLSNLDARLRESMRFELAKLHDRLQFTGLYVTHDQSEAMAVASRIAVMFDGRIHQLGSPREVYETPVSPRVARFLGSPYFATGSLMTADRPRPGYAEVATPLGLARGRLAQGAAAPGRAALVCLRPERVHVVATDEPIDWPEPTYNRWEGRVTQVAFLGSHLACMVEVGGVEFRADVPLTRSQRLPGLQPGQQVTVAVAVEDLLVFDADLEQGAPEAGADT